MPPKRDPEVAYARFLRGRRVALVGPAPTLEGTDSGGFIDNHDLVVRINRGHQISADMARDVGARTDVLYHNLWFGVRPPGDREALIATIGPEIQWVCGVNPPLNLDHTHAHDVAAFRAALGSTHLFRTVDMARYLALFRRLLSRPNAGISALFDLLGFDLSGLHVTGFSFYTGARAYRTGYEGEGVGTTHDQTRQRTLMGELVRSDARLTVDRPLATLLDLP